MNLGDRKAQQILDALVEVRKLPLRAEIFEEIDLGDGDVNAAQIEQVLEVRGRAARHDWQNPHLIAVIDYSSDLLGEAHERAIEPTTDKAYGPCIPGLVKDGFRIATRQQLLLGNRLTDSWSSPGYSSEHQSQEASDTDEVRHTILPARRPMPHRSVSRSFMKTRGCQ